MTTLAHPMVLEPLADIGRPQMARTTFGTNLLLSAALVGTISLIVVLTLPDCRHWFMFPLMIVGTVMGVDLIAWARRQIDVFDPLVFTAGTAVFGYCVAPMLHVGWDIYDPLYNSLDDWPKRFGQFGLLLIPSILLFRLGQRITSRRPKPPRSFWAMDNSRFIGGVTIGLLISGAAAAYMQIQFRGLQKDAILDREAVEALGHLSWIMMLEHPFAFLLTLAVVQLAYDPNNPKQRSLLFVLMLLAGLFVVQFMLVGLRGSRSATVSAVFIAAGVIHYRVRRFKVVHALAGLALLCAFMYFYLFFKRKGTEGLEALQGGAEARAILQEEGQFSFQTMLLGDMARADVQTFALYRLIEYPDEYELRWGWLYANAFIGFIPRAVWPTKPVRVKNVAGIELEEGTGSADPEFYYSVKIYGLPGEAMLSFGLWGVPPMFMLYGLLLGWYRGRLAVWDPRDARFLLVPWLTYVSMSAWIGDSDNLVFSALVNGVLPFAVVYNGSKRVPTGAAALA